MEFTGERHHLDHARQFEIFLVVIEEVYNRPVVYLREVDGPRRIPVLIGYCEAIATDSAIKDRGTLRPQTHDALAAAIRLLGGEVEHVVVNNLENNTYYSDARIRKQSESLTLRIRPSDGFVLAILFGCPVFFTDEVLEKVDRQAVQK